MLLKMVDLKVDMLGHTGFTKITIPCMHGLKKAYHHLRGIHFDNEDYRSSHLIRLIL